MGGMSYEGYQDHRQVNAALLQQQLQLQQQQQQQQAAVNTQATLQMAAMQIQQQQFGLGQPPPAIPAMLPQLPPQQPAEEQLQQHILSYAASASLSQQPVAAMPVMVPPQTHRIPSAGATTVINGMPYQLQMNSDGTQVWVPIVPHSMTSYTKPPMMSLPTTTTFQNVLPAQMQAEQLTSLNLQQPPQL